MDRPAPAVRVIPEDALVHFALTQRQHAAVLAAIKFFAQKLRDPGERAIAESAWAAMSTITHFSLPSEMSVAEAAPVRSERDAGDVPVPAPLSAFGSTSASASRRGEPAANARTTAERAFGSAKGLGALTKR